MGHELKARVSARWLAEKLDLKFIGPDVEISNVSSLQVAESGTLCFSKSAIPADTHAECIAIVQEQYSQPGRIHLIAKNPRLAFAQALDFLEKAIGFSRPTSEPIIDSSARVSPHSVLGLGVSIGPGTVVNHFCVIGDGVQIGANCVIKSGAVIGEDGFGFERDQSGIPIRLVHLGSVKIANHVEIGSLTTVCRGTLTDTVIEEHAKIDDHVHIAHNCHIGMGAMVVACAEVSGGVILGKGSWIGPNASIIQQRKVGESALIGIGSNVIRDVDDFSTVAGNPAKPLGSPKN